MHDILLDVWGLLVNKNDISFYRSLSADAVVSPIQVMAVDCKLGVNQLVYSPPALSHRSHHKTATVENSVFVGASPSYTCTYHNSKSNFQVFYHEVFWEGGLDGGNTAIIFASFTSTVNSKYDILFCSHWVQET